MQNIANLANWIQAGAAVCIVVFTAWTLRVLRDYANDTNRIANDSASQTDRAQMPFLTITREDGDGGWVVENQGFGPALNAAYTFSKDGKRLQRCLPSLGPGGCSKVHVHNDFGTTIGEKQSFDIEYESLSGKRYGTVVKMLEGSMLSQFTQL